MDLTHAFALASLLGLTQPEAVGRLSRDFYWYSQVLRKQLDDAGRENRETSEAPGGQWNRLNLFFFQKVAGGSVNGVDQRTIPRR